MKSTFVACFHPAFLRRVLDRGNREKKLEQETSRLLRCTQGEKEKHQKKVMHRSLSNLLTQVTH